ncbi:hypothetical protein AMATHDRAFT_73660 [Amanita thiersii Skay4041]|uniref:Amino acid transporter transmembrane domain-containing protein n=1 Tax=Amanita thiersii Skay4041 TaxID=703135 RepID=A0A2A9NUT9_9AGAR|nr:hypothetical protein AMATHDRAFT_73660 [Amanita thiersii Skay4041]
MAPICLAFYCSGHGYGHATRVSAFASHLLQLSDAERPVTIYIVSSAPQHVFAESIACGASYRYAEIDPIIVQPLAYRVDRQKSVQALKNFLQKKDALLESERQWLLGINASAVLSDAAFLGCQAAKLAGIPSILITNFTFDSVYSYLSTQIKDRSTIPVDELLPTAEIEDNVADIPVPLHELQPLVDQIHYGYRCADLLIRLPGHIPIPSFTVYPLLPSTKWVAVHSNRFTPEILDHLSQPVTTCTLHQKIPYPFSPNPSQANLTRSVISAPLLVRPPTPSPSVYSFHGRLRLLKSLGVPDELIDSIETKILIVSFGGQVFRGPSRHGSRRPSELATPNQETKDSGLDLFKTHSSVSLGSINGNTAEGENHKQNLVDPVSVKQSTARSRPTPLKLSEVNARLASSRLTTTSHILVPGAPPALRVIPASPLSHTCAQFPDISAVPYSGSFSPPVNVGFDSSSNEVFEEPRLLPDPSWIAIICGVTKEQWTSQFEEEEMSLPNRFFVAPRDVYMPDLTAVADVLLGKLGYGTVSECVDACTPFVYVSRPLFIEEHGLRLLLEKEGVGVELSRASYEEGEWAKAISQAWELGREEKARKHDLPDEERIKILRRHLALKDERNPRNGEIKSSAASELDVPQGSDSSTLRSRRSSNGAHGRAQGESEDSTFPIPYHAPGADVTHDIYKWHAEQTRQAARARSASFAGPSNPPHPAFEHIHEPGGFRRNYVLLHTNNQGEEPQILNNFIDFLLLFGHFAGEDLEEEEEDKSDEENTLPGASVAAETENTPLLQGGSTLSARQRSRSRRRRGNSISSQGNATVTQAVLMLLKSFVGTGVLFLGKAFYNGGILFSSLTFVAIAIISLYSFLLLVEAKFVVPGSFGDIGGALYGNWMRYTILGSIVISQLGFVSAYTIFVAQNLQAFIMGITNCMKLVSVHYLILIQLVVFLPLALIRDLAKLSTTALVADAFILAGLVYIFGSEFKIIMERGLAHVELFNPKDFPLFIGTAVFSFEGIGLIIPITDAMREPHKFPAVLTGVMMFLLVLFGGAGVLAYLTFGKDIQTVVLVNLDGKSKMVQSVQFFYSMAILLSVPLQLFPAVRILENGFFTRSGKANIKVKWLKNFFRFCMVMLCSLVSSAGAADLDKFVALVGCFACVPLCYVYPAMLHYKACADTRRKKIADIAMIIFGLAAAAYTTIQTVRLMLAPEDSGQPTFGHCDPSIPNT